MFPHRGGVCRGLCAMIMNICIHVYMYACVRALGKEWMRATGGLLAQSTGGRDGGIEGKEGAAG